MSLSQGRPTMRDVASTAGVSLKTVSRVVNGEPGVRPAVAARVQDAIATLGFRRNDLARSLRHGRRSSTIGLVIGDLANPFYSAIARAVEAVAHRHQTMLISGSSEEDPDREREIVNALLERRVDGLIVVPAGNDHRYLNDEADNGTPAVFVDRPPGNLAADVILIDNAGGAVLAVDHLLRQGHVRIGVVGDAMSLYTTAQRIKGYRAAMTAAGHLVDEGLLELGSHNADAAEAATRRLLERSAPPTAIFSTNNRNTVGALRAVLAEAPGTALVGFDDFELADLLARPVTVVRHDPAEMGSLAAELLFRRIDGDTRPPRRKLIRTELVQRGSGEVRPPGERGPRAKRT